MHNARRIVLFLALLLLGLAPFGFGQFGNQSRNSRRTLGYYDPATGAFEPLRPDMDADTAPLVAATTGTLVFKFTITVDSTVPNHGVVGCSADASVSDTSGFFADEHGSAIATHTSGKTYSCTVTMPYSWTLASASTDKITLAVSADLIYGYEATATNGTGTVVQPVTQRVTDQSLGTIKVPTSGGPPTNESVNLTI